jgi:hypothetical protein
MLRIQRVNNNILIVLHRFGTETYVFAMQLEDYSGEAHLSAVMAAIQYSEKVHDTDEFSPDFEGKDDDSFSLLQNPTKTPIISKDFLRALPHCPIITGHLKCSTNLNFVLVMFKAFQSMEGKQYVLYS